jgi:error-prone DNA polymerase
LLFSLGIYQPTDSGTLAFPPETSVALESLPDFSPYERLCHEWNILSFSPERHPLEFWRSGLQQKQVLTNTEIKSIESTTRLLRAAGWVIRPHTPPTKSGKTIVFFSLEDETGLLNVTVFPSIYEKHGHLIFSHPLLMIEGRKDKRGANSLVAEKLWTLSPPSK